ncbi:HD domain-containing phosphohydrolase [uncultured Selenomonas sp.]|uniref:HD-GYP domain-containing protein n=1 Tax=uncultured Selenomonas sp. TaxID=159275 RepID=UPI0028DD0304|nr:HD domain-containing phosphohydrolase [uncultured Selenomonas sp.]
MMLKKCSVARLKEGMVLGQDVYKDDMTVLLGEGTVLTPQMIEALVDRNIFSVHIQVEDETKAGAEEEEALSLVWKIPSRQGTPEAAGKVVLEKSPDDERAQEPVAEAPKTVPEKERLQDYTYVRQYDEVFASLKELYADTRATSRLDAQAVQSLARKFLPLCESVKAVVQIYNMDTEDDHRFHHSMHVAILAGLMGQFLKLRATEKERLIMAGFLLDIGTTRIAEEFLEIQGYYSSADRRLMQKHTTLGQELLAHSALAADEQVVGAVLQHHERNDGSGYPSGLKKEQICGFARILAIVDIYDAMASNRTYKRKRSPFDVFKILADDILHGRLDTEYGVCFIRHIGQALNGCWVRLSDGGVGKIVYIDESRIDGLPVVQTMSGEFLDLNKNSRIKVVSLITSDEVQEA